LDYGFISKCTFSREKPGQREPGGTSSRAGAAMDVLIIVLVVATNVVMA
jgi:hypothetical protein